MADQSGFAVDENAAPSLDAEIEEELMETQPQADEGKQSGSRLSHLPHTRVRNMMKLDSDLHIASQESVFLVTKAAVSMS